LSQYKATLVIEILSLFPGNDKTFLTTCLIQQLSGRSRTALCFYAYIFKVADAAAVRVKLMDKKNWYLPFKWQ